MHKRIPILGPALATSLVVLAGGCAAGNDADGSGGTPSPPTTGGTAGTGGSGTGGESGSSIGGGPAVDRDEDGYAVPADCDDTDASIHPGAPEDRCDQRDNNCDGSVDEAGPYKKLYFISYDQTKAEFALNQSDLDGQNMVRLESAIPQTTFLEVDATNGDLYLSTVFSGLLRRKPAGGFELMQGYISDGQGIGLDSCARTAYWGQYHGGLYAVDMDSSAPVVEIVAKAALPAGAEGIGAVEIDVAGDALFFLSIDDDWGSETKLWKAGTDGAGLAALGVDHPHHCLALDPAASKLYFTRSNSNLGAPIMARVNLDGTALEELFTLPPGWGCHGLALDTANDRMYLGLVVQLDPTNTAQLLRVNLDGTGQVVLPVAPNPHAVTLAAE